MNIESKKMITHDQSIARLKNNLLPNIHLGVQVHNQKYFTTIMETILIIFADNQPMLFRTSRFLPNLHTGCRHTTTLGQPKN